MKLFILLSICIQYPSVFCGMSCRFISIDLEGTWHNLSSFRWWRIRIVLVAKWWMCLKGCISRCAVKSSGIWEATLAFTSGLPPRGLLNGVTLGCSCLVWRCSFSSSLLPDSSCAVVSCNASCSSTPGCSRLVHHQAVLTTCSASLLAGSWRLLVSCQAVLTTCSASLLAGSWCLFLWLAAFFMRCNALDSPWLFISLWFMVWYHFGNKSTISINQQYSIDSLQTDSIVAVHMLYCSKP